MALKITIAELRRLLPGFDPFSEGLGTRIPQQAAAACNVPVCTRLEVSPGRWSVTVQNWCPVSDNVRAKGLKLWMAGKKRDREVIRDWVAEYARVPRATGRRRLSAWVTKKGPRPDGANLLKSLCDALVNTGLLIDDKAEWLEANVPVVGPGEVTATTIILEDVT